MVADPYLGIRPTDRFELGRRPTTRSTLDRLDGRDLAARPARRRTAHARRRGRRRAFDRHRALALPCSTRASSATRSTCSASRPRLRDRYGMTLFGQACLAARRLVEAGGQFVTVCWDEYGLVNTGWDTHGDHFPRMKDELVPGLDDAFRPCSTTSTPAGCSTRRWSSCLSEHGRTPRLQNVAGRRPRPLVAGYSALFAGGGFAAGPRRRPDRQDRRRRGRRRRSRRRTCWRRCTTCSASTRRRNPRPPRPPLPDRRHRPGAGRTPRVIFVTVPSELSRLRGCGGTRKFANGVEVLVRFDVLKPEARTQGRS